LRSLKQTKTTKNKTYDERAAVNRIRQRLAPAVVLFAGAVFMLAGIYRGEMDVVLRKAINLCLECIGIG